MKACSGNSDAQCDYPSGLVCNEGMSSTCQAEQGTGGACQEAVSCVRSNK